MNAPTNGSWQNYAAHAGIGAAFAILVGLLSTPLGGMLASCLYWIGKEAGEFSVKHPDAEGRPWADINPFHRLRTTDDRLDLFSGWAGGAIGAVALALI